MRQQVVAIVGNYRFVAAEDYDYWTRAISKGIRIASLPDALHSYRQWSLSLSSAHADRLEQAAVATASAYASMRLKREIPGDVISLVRKLDAGEGHLTKDEAQQAFAYIRDVFTLIMSKEGLTPTERKYIQKDVNLRLMLIVRSSRKHSKMTSLWAACQAVEINPSIIKWALARGVAKLRRSLGPSA